MTRPRRSKDLMQTTMAKYRQRNFAKCVRKLIIAVVLMILNGTARHRATLIAAAVRVIQAAISIVNLNGTASHRATLIAAVVGVIPAAISIVILTGAGPVRRGILTRTGRDLFPKIPGVISIAGVDHLGVVREMVNRIRIYREDVHPAWTV